MQTEVEVSKKIPCFECLFWNTNGLCYLNCKKLGDWLMQLTQKAEPVKASVEGIDSNRPKQASIT